MSHRHSRERSLLVLVAVLSAVACGTLPEIARPIRAHPDRIQWDHEPTVAAASVLLVADTVHALEDWRWGRFVGVGSCERVDICVDHGFHEPGDSHAAGRAYFEHETGTCTARIIIQSYAVVVHEIGHCLGLGHSSDERSYMFPVARHSQFDPVTGDWHPVFITMTDRDVLRELMP